MLYRIQEGIFDSDTGMLAETGDDSGAVPLYTDGGLADLAFVRARYEERMAPARAEALEQLRLRKWEARNAGITVNGIAIDTDDRGQATINGAVTNVILDPAFTATWKTNATNEHGQSVWIVLDATMIVGLSKAMTAYTEACFAVEAGKQAELAALANARDIRDWLELYLDDGWPDREIAL